jgi:adenylate kinase family enzyme
MIINLVGPPGAGKSTFAARFVLEHPEFKYCPIDEYGIKNPHFEVSWSKLLADALSSRNVLIESNGCSQYLADVLNNETIRRRHLFTIAFMCNFEEISLRLKSRHKRPVPFAEGIGPNDEFVAAKYLIENVLEKSVAPIDYTIWTDQYMEPADYYQELTDQINKARMNTLFRSERRKSQLTGIPMGKR